MNDQQLQWPKHHPQPQQFWSPTNQGWSHPQPVNQSPSRQFKSPLAQPSLYEQQQYGQAQWTHQQFLQPAAQPRQPQWSPRLQLPTSPKSPLSRPQSRHFKRWPWLILGIVALVVLFASIGVGHLASEENLASQTATASQAGQSSQPAQQAGTQAASQPTTISTPHATNWVTTRTFTGTGEKKTTTFTVGNTWKIIWTCNPGTIFGGQGSIIVNVFSSDGTFQHGAINDTCKAGHTTGNTIEQQGGNIYLDITGGGNWTIQIQELK